MLKLSGVAIIFFASLLCLFQSIVHGIALPSCDSPTFSPNETIQANSVTVYMRSICGTTMVANRTIYIYYTTDGTDPIVDVSRFLVSGESILIESVGKTTISASAIANNYDASKVVKKTYEVIPSCPKPTIYPNGGTFSGSVSINVLADTQADASSSVTYKIMNTISNDIISHGTVAAGSDIIVSFIGSFYLQLYAERDSCFKSTTYTSGTFTINAKVSNPVITPIDNIYTISATLFFTCGTPSGTHPSRY